MPSSFLLRIEGINLDHFVFDTRDLSTVRGGSLMLLEAVGKAVEFLETQGVNPKVISQGASVGIVQISTEDATKAAEDLRAQLRKDFPHATFAVAVTPDAKDYGKEREQLLAQIRWHQLQGASLAIPPRNTTHLSQPACGLNGILPASLAQPRGKLLSVSDSVASRRKEGSKAKQNFYSRLIREVLGAEAVPGDLPEFAPDFESIALGCQPREGKLAVFYADGNSFGKLQQELCTDLPKQALWDRFIRRTRTAFLKQFLETEVISKPEWKNGDNRARFETLLWGGDELMFVMPAAFGWRFAQQFFAFFGGRNLREAEADQSAEADWKAARFESNAVLTHTAALVFCQSHAPIDRIKHLAKEQMAEFAKSIEIDGEPIGRKRDQLVVVALESFDNLGSSYESAMQRRYSGSSESEFPLASMVLAGNSNCALGEVIEIFARQIETLKTEANSFARGKLRQLVLEILSGAPLPDFEKLFSAEEKGAFRNANHLAKAAGEALAKDCFQDQKVLWLQLEELWDYALA